MGLMMKYPKTVISVSNTISFNTDVITGSCYRIFCKPPSESVTYDIKFTDDNNLDVYVEKGIRGTLNDITQRSMKGIYTVTIENISSDGEFKFQLEWEEKLGGKFS
jgi:hypothetical protein